MKNTTNKIFTQLTPFHFSYHKTSNLSTIYVSFNDLLWLKGCDQFLNWSHQCATGTLHSSLFRQKKEDIPWMSSFFWWIRRDSNPRPLGCEPNALPAELRTRFHFFGGIFLNHAAAACATGHRFRGHITEPGGLPAELRTHLHFCCIIIAHSSEKSTVIFVVPLIFFQNFTG